MNSLQLSAWFSYDLMDGGVMGVYRPVTSTSPVRECITYQNACKTVNGEGWRAIEMICTTCSGGR